MQAEAKVIVLCVPAQMVRFSSWCSLVKSSFSVAPTAIQREELGKYHANNLASSNSADSEGSCCACLASADQSSPGTPQSESAVTRTIRRSANIHAHSDRSLCAGTGGYDAITNDRKRTRWNIRPDLAQEIGKRTRVDEYDGGVCADGWGQQIAVVGATQPVRAELARAAVARFRCKQTCRDSVHLHFCCGGTVTIAGCSRGGC